MSERLKQYLPTWFQTSTGPRGTIVGTMEATRAKGLSYSISMHTVTRGIRPTFDDPKQAAVRVNVHLPNQPASVIALAIGYPLPQEYQDLGQDVVHESAVDFWLPHIAHAISTIDTLMSSRDLSERENHRGLVEEIEGFAGQLEGTIKDEPYVSSMPGMPKDAEEGTLNTKEVRQAPTLDEERLMEFRAIFLKHLSDLGPVQATELVEENSDNDLFSTKVLIEGRQYEIRFRALFRFVGNKKAYSTYFISVHDPAQGNRMTALFGGSFYKDINTPNSPSTLAEHMRTTVSKR